MQIISRDAAKKQGLTRFFTGRPCKYGHVSERLTSINHCVECHNSYASNWKKKNRKACSETSQLWQTRNRERVRKLKKANYRNNEDVRKAQALRAKKWLTGNREKSKASTAKYRTKNLARAAAAQQRRRAKLLQRTPVWSDQGAILQFYLHAREMTIKTGIPHEVDHIYPLQGELVSGLHVETNLRVVPQADNRSKGNRLVGIDSPNER